MELYPLLPGIVRQTDAQASQQMGVSVDETFWQKVLAGTEAEAGALASLITGLRDFASASNCPETALALLAQFLGAVLYSGWSTESKRFVLQSAMQLAQCSGRQLSWKAYLNLMGHPGALPVELWKENVYETFSYSNTDDYYGSLPYHAARVTVRNPDDSVVFLTDAEQTALDHFRPIHVLRKCEGAQVLAATDSNDFPPEDAIGTEATLSLTDALGDASDDGLLITLTCVRQGEIY